MTPPMRQRSMLILAAVFVLVSLCHSSSVAPAPSDIAGTGCRALREIRAEGGIVLPKGTEFRFLKDPLNDGGGKIVLTLLVDDAETLKAQVVTIENPSLMYHVAK